MRGILRLHHPVDDLDRLAQHFPILRAEAAGPPAGAAGSLRYVRRSSKGGAARPVRPAPEPIPVNTVTVMGVGTLLWFIAFCVLLVLLLVRGRAAEAGHSEWRWITLAGWLLGLTGMYLSHRQRRPR